jgi:hypothetical protein
MANTGLAFNDSAGGNRGYNGLWIGNVTTPFGTTGTPSLLREAFFAATKDAVLPTIVTVAAGVPILTGSLLDHDGVSTPPGVVVTVKKPDGTLLDTSQPVYTDDLMIHIDAVGNLASFMIKNPAVGNWTITTTIPDGPEPSYQLFVSTMPTGTDDQVDMETTLQTAFQNRFTAEQLDGFVEKFGLVGWGCFWCQVGVWAVAIALVILGVFLAGQLTVTTTIVTALAAFANVAATTAMAFIKTIMALITMGVNKIITSICGWTGACGNAMDASGTDGMIPQGGY